MSEDKARHWIEGMMSTLVHRGPDASGFVFDANGGIGLGHRRLSILDLSDRGAQPMWSASGRHCIVYNGEVYNAPEIRKELEALGFRIDWRGHSDTEVVIEAIEAVGLEAALDRFRGMFAFAVWDHVENRVSLVRDRLGIKPLFYVQGDYGVAFASELPALYEIPAFQPQLNRRALASFLRYAVVPDSECIVGSVSKVKPGTIVQFAGPKGPPSETTYWDATKVAYAGLRTRFEGSERDAVEALTQTIRDAVALRMRSDVPFGAFLSGGIDSSTVAALMQDVSSSSIKTFCIGSSLPGYDESDHAKAVAQHLGTQHRTLIADPSEVLQVVPDIAHRWDEPFADSSQIPTFLVSKLTREHVTVSLSGDGGDELFAGYNRHAWAPKLWGAASRVPTVMRQALGVLKLLKIEDWDRAFQALGLGDSLRLPGDKIYKVAALAEVDTPHQFYERLRSHWIRPEEVLANQETPQGHGRVFDAPFAEQMMLFDQMEYLPDDILTKVDRASMAVSLEARVPLLDHHVVELAWKLPLDWKIRGRVQKWILREVLGRHVPPSLFERPKMGFGVPIGRWLRGPLNDWATALLEPRALERDDIFAPDIVARTWRAHQDGRGNHEHQLWAILMFQSWWQANRRKIEA